MFLSILDVLGANDSTLSFISTTSSNLWTEGERILKGEIDLSDSMQLCLDGKDPTNHERDCIESDRLKSSTNVEYIPNLIGPRGMKGIERYLQADSSNYIEPTGTATKGASNKDNIGPDHSTEINMSYAETVSALLKSPQPLLLSTLNKENDNKICDEKIGTEFEYNGLKGGRKRSLTEMIGHNPLSKERKPLGQKSCFETDL